MSEEFLYGCGVIPRGSNRLIHMTDSVDENASDVIASSKSVTNLKAETKTTVDQQIQDLNSYIDTQIATLNKTISALQQADTAMQNQIQQINTTITTPPTRNYSVSREADLAANTNFTVDSYIVGSNSLTVWLNGLRCQNGVDFNEIGTVGQASTAIQFVDIVTSDICIAWSIE